MRDFVYTGEKVECIESGLWSKKGEIYPVILEFGFRFALIESYPHQKANLDSRLSGKRFVLVSSVKEPKEWL